MSAITRSTQRGRLYKKIDGLGFQGTADSVSATGIVDAAVFGDARHGVDDYEGRYIYLPAIAVGNDDRVKVASLLSSTTLTQEMSAYVTTSAQAYEIVGLMHPDDLNDCLRRAARRGTFRTRTPVTPWYDGDFSIAEASWSGQDSGGTSTYSATAIPGFPGYNHLHFVSTAAADYGESQSLSVVPGDVYHLSSISRVNGAYTLTTKIWDVTNGAEILPDAGVATSHSERVPQHMTGRYTIPSGCRQIRFRYQLSGAGNCDIAPLPGHLIEATKLTPPTWLSERWMLYSLQQADYDGRQLAVGRVNESTVRYRDWYRPADYDFDVFTEEANFSALFVQRSEGLPEADMWYYGRRPFSSIAAWDDETDALDTNGDDEEFLTVCCEAEVYKLLWERYDEGVRGKYWALWQEAEARIAAEHQSRQPQQPSREVLEYTPGGRA